MELLFAALGAVLLLFGLLGLFAGATAWLIYSHLLLGALLLAYAALRRFGHLADVLRGTAGRGGANAVVQTASIVVICALLGFVTVRNPVNWDWTEAGIHTLSDATLSVLERIPEGQYVEILGFFTRGSERPAQHLLDMYTYRSERVRVAFHDPNERPELAQRFEIRSAEGVLLVCGGSCETAQGTVRVSAPSENEVTKAIRSVISEQRRVYVLAGHGEASLEDAEAEGFAVMKAAMEDENYEVSELILANESQVPETADAVLILGPTHSLLDAELQMLDRFLRGGGGVAVLADPLVVTALEDQVAAWGIELGDDVIVEEQRTLFSGPQLAVQPIVSSYGTHPITDKLSNQLTLYNMARSVRAAEGAAEESTELVLTSSASWAESDTKKFVEESAVSRDPESDRVGPVALAVATTFDAEEGGREGRLVVVGDSDFARNRYVAQGYNADLFLNMVGWLVGEEAFASIERRVPRASSAAITWDQFANFRFVSLFMFPESILLLGVFGWWRRRH